MVQVGRHRARVLMRLGIWGEMPNRLHGASLLAALSVCEGRRFGGLLCQIVTYGVSRFDLDLAWLEDLW